MSNVVDFTLKVKEKDLESLARVLSEKAIALMIENQRLQEKVAHLEELLKNTESVPTIGKNNDI